MIIDKLNGISTFVGDIMSKPSLLKSSTITIQSTLREKLIHTFPKANRPKINVTGRLEFKHAYYNGAVWCVGHITMKIILFSWSGPELFCN